MNRVTRRRCGRGRDGHPNRQRIPEGKLKGLLVCGDCMSVWDEPTRTWIPIPRPEPAQATKEE